MTLFGLPNIDKMKTKRDIKGLIKALSYKENQRVRAAAAGALGQIGDARAVEPLIAALRDSHVCEAAASALRNISYSRAVEALIAVLKDSSEPFVRASAARNLKEMGWRPSQDGYR